MALNSPREVIKYQQQNKLSYYAESKQDYLHCSNNGSNNRYGIMGLRRNNGGKQFVEEENRFNIRYMIRNNNRSSLPWNRSSSTFNPMVAATSNDEVDQKQKK